MFPYFYTIDDNFCTTPLAGALNNIKLNSIWLITKEFPNKMLVVKVHNTFTKKSFVLATTHFPYLNSQISTIYIIQFIQILQMYEATLPIIFTGGFNFTPDSYQYNVVVTGIVDATDPSYPKISNKKYPEFNDFKWNTKINSMISAYGIDVVDNDYTLINFEKKPLVLDYIFCYNCRPITMKIENNGETYKPLPNECEPSDHLMVQAIINL
jgi:endonuclease/exonuclease/phosphatase family metal-dependent hydrolase